MTTPHPESPAEGADPDQPDTQPDDRPDPDPATGGDGTADLAPGVGTA